MNYALRRYSRQAENRNVPARSFLQAISCKEHLVSVLLWLVGDGG
jgi:hypothetical protein